MVLSVIPYFSVGDWRPSKEPRIAMMAEKSARLATQHASSMGHHTCCFRDRHADRKRRLDNAFSLPGLGLVEQGEDDMFAEAVLTGVDLVGAWSPEHPTLIETNFLGIVTRHQMTRPRRRGTPEIDRSCKRHYCKDGGVDRHECGECGCW